MMIGPDWGYGLLALALAACAAVMLWAIVDAALAA